jgi:large subunit ribosomal protein L27
MEKRNMEISPIRKYLKDDNFQIFEGINPKVEAILKKAAFYRWEDLARASYTELKIVMHDAGPRFRVHNPRSWSKQAKLALEDKWAELIDFQKEINAIENNSLGLINHSKVENILASSKGLAK